MSQQVRCGQMYWEHCLPLAFSTYDGLWRRNPFFRGGMSLLSKLVLVDRAVGEVAVTNSHLDVRHDRLGKGESQGLNAGCSSI